MLKFLIAAILLLSTLSAKADVNAGVQALQANDYGRAFTEFRSSALAGNAEAQFQMCGMYFNGLGVPVNDREAVNWCSAAAKQGHIEASYNLGLMHMNGDGVAQNVVEAEYWFKKAASRGHPDAQYNLEQIYNSNRVFDRAVKEQAEKQALLKQAGAVSSNLPPSAITTYPQAVPQAVPQAPPPALAIIPQAAPQAIPAAPVQTNTAAAPVPQTRISQIPPQQQIPRRLSLLEQQNNKKQRDCLQAVQAGYIPENCFDESAPVLLEGQQSLEGQDLTPIELAAIPELTTDFSEIEWLTEESRKGNVVAMNNLGVMYRRGQGVAKDEETAFKLFEQGAAKGSTNAILNLASMYKLGEGTEQNLELAYAWFNLAADRMEDGPQKQGARQDVKEISEHLSNEQIGSALEYINELDESIPMYQEKKIP